MGKQRLLMFIVSFRSEAELRGVLARIPRAVLEGNDCEVLIVGDAAIDLSSGLGQLRRTHPHLTLTVLESRYHHGYGGNQKLAYAYATAEGFDLVALLHGDGRYAPEELPRLLEPLGEGRADAVFGSRMTTPFGALRGGMPLYKFVGNRILTALQNALLGSRLSELHSGYRIYSVRALQAIPHRLNSDDLVFDTQVAIQLLNAGMRILELPIPTYHSDEIGLGEGVRYARAVLAAAVRNAFHRSGLLYQRRLDPLPIANTHYDLKLGYASSHTYALAAVPDGSAVIDVGAGPGGLAQELVKKGCRTATVDQYPAAQPGPIENFVQDLDAELTFDVRPYRYILLLDIIEHLRQPELFLERLRRQFDHEPRTVILTTPNIAFVVQRFMLLLGQFNYGRVGILDRTHARLFTFRGIRHLLRDAGLRITEIRGVPAPFPKVLGHGLLGRLALGLNLALIRVSKTLFSYQIYVEAETTPDVDFLLAEAKLRRARDRHEPPAPVNVHAS